MYQYGRCTGTAYGGLSRPTVSRLEKEMVRNLPRCHQHHSPTVEWIYSELVNVIAVDSSPTVPAVVEITSQEYGTCTTITITITITISLDSTSASGGDHQRHDGYRSCFRVRYFSLASVPTRPVSANFCWSTQPIAGWVERIMPFVVCDYAILPSELC